MIKEKKRPSFLSKKTHFSVPWRRICSLSISSSCNPKQRTKKLKTLEKKKKKNRKRTGSDSEMNPKKILKKKIPFFSFFCRNRPLETKKRYVFPSASALVLDEHYFHYYSLSSSSCSALSSSVHRRFLALSRMLK